VVKPNRNSVGFPTTALGRINNGVVSFPDVSIRGLLKYLFGLSVSLISTENLSSPSGDFEAYDSDKRSGVSVTLFNCVLRIAFLDTLSVPFVLTKIFKLPSSWNSRPLPYNVQLFSLLRRFVPSSYVDPL
jgi:hypothetical protein